MKRFLMRTVAIWTACAVMCCVIPATNAVSTSANSAILMDADSGRVLFESNADARSLIASTTKIMTALVVCEQTNVLDRVQIMPEAVGIEGSSMYLRAGEVLTVQELLYGLMLHSGNDAAVALAIYCGGTVEGFVQLMNDEARRLGLKDTHFENPNGLDHEHHYSTARDLALLTAYAMENQIFAKTVSTKTVRIGERSLTNHNKLLWRCEGVDGGKTGYTKAAGRILVSTALRNGRRLVAVTIHDPNDWEDHARLFDYGFSQFEPKQLVSRGQSLGSLEVVSDRIETVELLAMEDFSYPVTEEESCRFHIGGPGFVYGPVKANENAGIVYVMLNDKVIGRIPVCWSRSVEVMKQEKPKNWIQRILGDNA